MEPRPYVLSGTNTHSTHVKYTFVCACSRIWHSGAVVQNTQGDPEKKRLKAHVSV